jgi:hypothetical protein
VLRFLRVTAQCNWALAMAPSYSRLQKTFSAIGCYRSELTLEFSQDLDKEICVAAQKKADEKVAEKRKKREEEERREREEKRPRQHVGGGVGGAHMTSETLEYPTVDQTTIWAHLEFEDGQIVPLENSVSTSFYIGREPSPHEHHHRFYHEDDILCRRVSRAHCQILRLDTGSFSSYVLSLNIVLLILMKYVN